MTYPVLPANGPSGYNLTNSLRFRSSASAYLNRTFGTPTSAYKWTLSFWIKLGTGATTNYVPIFGAGAAPNNLLIDMGSAGLRFFAPSSGATVDLETTQVFRDPSAWYHVIYAVDTTQATASNRVKLYVNGSQVTAFSVATYPALNATFYANQNATAHYIGSNTSASYFDGYMAEYNFIDGQALTPSSFGSTNATTGVWQPAKYTGTYGTNGFYLNFSNIALTSGSNTGLGKDYSGNGNYWNTNNISVTAGTTYDAMTDVPTLTSATVANYCTLNPLSNLDATTLSAGNLNLLSTTNSSSVFGTIGISSGKWYWEVICYDGVMTGVSDTQRSGGTYPGNFANSCAWNTYYTLNTANTYVSGTFTKAGTISGSAGVNGDVIGCALDMDAGTIKYYVNGVVTNSGNAVFTNITGTVYPLFRGALGSTSSVNFGQRGFAYTPPTGYVALNTYNLPTSTIVQGNKYFNVNIWTGNGTSQAIVNSGSMQPDLMWTKSRSVNGYYHVLIDSVRGITKALYSNATDAENTLATRITSINSNGYTVGSSGDMNDNAQTFVGWQWQAGQGSTSSNTNGSITSTVSVNTTAGFSVVTFTANGVNGATVGHGLGVAPKMFILKTRSNVQNWPVYHASIGNTGYVTLNTTAATITNIGAWNNTSPTSSVFTIGDPGYFYTNGYTYVAYCWAEIAGFSKFGSYTGNGSTDGPFVFTNFAPKFVMFKRTDTTSGWYIQDSTRNTSNVVNLRLLPNTSDAEATVTTLDFLSNGFKLRTSDIDRNASGGTYIYACFASNPFRNSNAF